MKQGAGAREQAGMSQAEPGPRAVVLEVADREVGLLVREHAGVTFYAACPEAAGLDRRRFPTLGAAAAAVRRRLAPRRAAPAVD